MPHQTKPGDSDSYVYGHTIGEYPEVIERIIPGSKKFLSSVDPIIVNTNDAEKFVKDNNNSNQKTFGLSGTNIKTFDKSLGALAPLLNQASGIMDKIYGATVEPTQKEKDINMGRIALQFFTQMGASASQPGQTALGAANIAGANVAQSYLAKVQSDKDKKAKLEQAKKSGGLSLAMSMQAQDQAREIALAKAKNIKPTYKNIYKIDSGQTGENVINAEVGSKDYLLKTGKGGGYTTDKPKDTGSFTFKASDSFIAPVYVKTRAEAEAYLSDYVKLGGLDKNSSSYKRVVDALIAPEDKQGLLGKPLIIQDKFGIIKPVQIGNKIGSVDIIPNDKGAVPNWVSFKTKYNVALGKDFQAGIEIYSSVIPRVKEAMRLLISKNGPDTGGMTPFTLPLKGFINQLIGNYDPQVTALQNLRSTSIYLATKMRPVGSGSTSDIEFAAYQRIVADLGNTPQANYISLYAFQKMKENSIKLNLRTQELIDTQEVRNAGELNIELQKTDTGIFKKFQYEGEKYDANQDFTPEFIVARDKWAKTEVKDGDVIFNNDLYRDDNNKDEPYLIKGWRK